MADSVIRSRIDSSLKEEASHLFSSMGLTMSEAIRLFLVQTVVQGGLPFQVKAPNAETRAAMQESLAGKAEPVSLDQLADEWSEECGESSGPRPSSVT